MRSSLGRLVLGLAVLGAGSAAHAYYLDQSRNFDVRLRTYSQGAIATESSRESPPTFSPGDLFSQRNFYNPEFDANLTDYVGWTRRVGGFSLIAPDEFKFHFAWWGFYDGMFDYLSPQWRDALRAVPRSRQSSSDDIAGESTRFNDENKNPSNILGKRNRINELYLDFSKGRFFTRIGRQSISWGEADAIVFMDVINNFDLTIGVPGIFMDLEEERIPLGGEADERALPRLHGAGMVLPHLSAPAGAPPDRRHAAHHPGDHATPREHAHRRPGLPYPRLPRQRRQPHLESRQRPHP